ncbi:hypothetical protein TNCV_563121 [Trichonephila clavipes]|nr:hypothetical protein TNCV_563121 [Trichonephila clavipes]
MTFLYNRRDPYQGNLTRLSTCINFSIQVSEEHCSECIALCIQQTEKSLRTGIMFLEKVKDMMHQPPVSIRVEEWSKDGIIIDDDSRVVNSNRNFRSPSVPKWGACMRGSGGMRSTDNRLMRREDEH